MSNVTLEAYKDACNYPGIIDIAAVEDALARYCEALGVARAIVQIKHGWSIDNYDDLKRTVTEIALAAQDALAARDARDAQDAQDARAAWDARNAQDAWDALAALDARDALAARDARDARDAQDAQDARAARDAQDALNRFFTWCLARSGWWWSWDLSWISIYALGAKQLNKQNVSTWANPLFDAFVSGACFLYWTDKTLYWVQKPRIITEKVGDRRILHCFDGPAADFDSEPLYFWHGVLVPREWIKRKEFLTVSKIFAEQNAETRRAGCEIIGWDRVLAGIDAKLIDNDGDPLIGALYKGHLPGVNPCGFLKVRCGTGRDFVIPVPDGFSTAIEAQAWIYNMPASKWSTPEVRT